jgi:type IV secretory pathway VirB2 component (pilin)
VIAVCVLTIALASSAFGQNKPWTEWTKKDVDKTLSDSAWAQTQTEGGGTRSQDSSSQGAITSTMASKRDDQRIDAAARNSESGENKAAPSVRFHVRFLSAKPVRAAFARRVLLAQTEPNETLKQKLQGFIDGDFAEYIVVSVGVEVTDAKQGDMLTRAFSAATTDAIKEAVYLERKDGKKLFLNEYRAPGGDGMGAKFIFKRVLDGQPFLAATDNVKFVAQFNEKMKILTKYKLSEMMYDGKLEY